jgi:hypothetical protein
LGSNSLKRKTLVFGKSFENSSGIDCASLGLRRSIDYFTR